MNKKNLGSKTKELWKNIEYREHMSEVHKGKHQHTEEHKKELSKKWKENNPMKNKELAKKLGRLTSKRRKGKTYEEIMGKDKAKSAREKHSNTNINKYKNGWITMKGKRQTEETKRKRGIYRKGKECHSWIDGRSYNKSPNRYGDDWDKIRQLVYERDDYICQKCKQHKSLDVHHIIPFMETFDNSLSNLISLCRSCHMQEEKKLIIMERRKNV